MDRSLGSGVFARNPDAILDLIELPITEDRYLLQEHLAECALYDSAIKHYNPSYNFVSQDDVLSTKQMGQH
jgi:RecA-family ATPase